MPTATVPSNVDVKTPAAAATPAVAAPSYAAVVIDTKSEAAAVAAVNTAAELALANARAADAKFAQQFMALTPSAAAIATATASCSAPVSMSNSDDHKTMHSGDTSDDDDHDDGSAGDAHSDSDGASGADGEDDRPSGDGSGRTFDRMISSLIDGWFSTTYDADAVQDVRQARNSRRQQFLKKNAGTRHKRRVQRNGSPVRMPVSARKQDRVLHHSLRANVRSSIAHGNLTGLENAPRPTSSAVSGARRHHWRQTEARDFVGK